MLHGPPVKSLAWIGSAYKDLTAFPAPVQDDLGYALYLAQIGGKSIHAKPLSGFGGAGVLEIIDDYDGDTYRAVYTVRFAEVVYVLHSFQKKSPHGIQTPRQEIELVKARLRIAKEEYRLLQNKRPQENSHE